MTHSSRNDFSFIRIRRHEKLYIPKIMNDDHKKERAEIVNCHFFIEKITVVSYRMYIEHNIFGFRWTLTFQVKHALE